MQQIYKYIFTCLVFFSCTAVTATVKLPAVFSDGMVLQQKEKSAFWGWADAGEKIVIQPGWTKQSFSVIANKSGEWRVAVLTPSFGGPFEIKIKGNNTIALKDVLIGEVWLCSGQSNMAFTVKGAENAKAEIAAANYPSIRYFSVKRQYGPKEFNDASGSVWQATTPQTVSNFSAVAYFFAQKVHEETGIPVGLIFNAWGGTPAEAWVPSTVLSNDKILSQYNERWTEILNKVGDDSTKYNEKLKAWYESRKTVDSNKVKKPSEPQTLYYYKRPWREPSVLFNGLVSPLIPFTIKGVLWYQGESNVNYADEYYQLFSSLIESWRNRWQKQFPFYFVQIAPNGYSDMDAAARLREAQYLVSKKIPNTGMAATADVGNMKDIHPIKKKEVGERLALIALARDYGKKNTVYKGPEVKSISINNGAVSIAFNQNIKLLSADTPKGFEIGFKKPGSDSLIFKPAKTKLENNRVIIWSEETNKPLVMRYAWLLASEGNVTNGAGLPAYPFQQQLF